MSGTHTGLSLCWGFSEILALIGFPGRQDSPVQKTEWWRSAIKGHFSPSIKLLDNQMALIQDMFVAQYVSDTMLGSRGTVVNKRETALLSRPTALEKSTAGELCTKV